MCFVIFGRGGLIDRISRGRKQPGQNISNIVGDVGGGRDAREITDLWTLDRLFSFFSLFVDPWIKKNQTNIELQ